MHNGIIEMDSNRGKELGFTSEHFSHGSYLWEDRSRITISFIASRAKDNFRRLAETILATGKEIAIPTPLPMMERIVRKAGYKHTIENDPVMGPVEIWLMRQS